ILLDAGLEAVRADALAKTALAIAYADRLGLALRSPREDARRGAMVVLAVPEANRMSEWLKTQSVYTDSRRNEVLRFAPFVWNTPGEIERLFDGVEEGLRTGAHLRHHPEAAGPVT